MDAKPKGSSHGTVSDKTPGMVYSVLLTIWATVLAIEKRNKLLSAHRGADRGLFVLTDRYPQDEILGFNDGPLLARLSRAPDWLRRFEASSYALTRRLTPDLVLKLTVTLETAVRREPEMQPTVVEQRIESVKKLKFPGATVVSIDAEQPLERVILEIKREVWHIL
jgi:thymidylate kinase